MFLCRGAQRGCVALQQLLGKQHQMIDSIDLDHSTPQASPGAVPRPSATVSGGEACQRIKRRCADVVLSFLLWSHKQAMREKFFEPKMLVEAFVHACLLSEP